MTMNQITLTEDKSEVRVIYDYPNSRHSITYDIEKALGNETPPEIPKASMQQELSTLLNFLTQHMSLYNNYFVFNGQPVYFRSPRVSLELNKLINEGTFNFLFKRIGLREVEVSGPEIAQDPQATTGTQTEPM